LPSDCLWSLLWLFLTLFDLILMAGMCVHGVIMEVMIGRLPQVTVNLRGLLRN